MITKRYSLEDVREYVEGWLGSTSDRDALTMNEIVAMLKNTLACIEDSSDSLEVYIERKKYYGTRR